MKITCEIADDLLPIGTKVFIPRPVVKDVHEDEILGYFCILGKDKEKGDILYATDYRLRIVNMDRGTFLDAWKADEFFLSYQEAKEMAVTYPVVATQDEWFKAIGLKKDSDRLQYDEECELAPCCGTISDIRDLLSTIMEREYCTGMQKRTLVSLMNAHEPALGLSPALDKILAQLNICWRENQEPYVKPIK
jgi:hypothetical protein